MTEIRCQAAHPDDPTPCDGPPVVTILDASNAGADGCEHHAARLLASLEGSRVYALPDAPEGAALRVFKAADTIRPFPWLTDAPRTEPSQLSHAENRGAGEQSASSRPPVFGPTLINRDDDSDAHVIVQVALVLSREHLRTALAIGYAEMNDGRELDELTVKEIREEVEGHLGACAVIEIDRESRSVSARLARPDRAQLLAALDAALDRAYPRESP